MHIISLIIVLLLSPTSYELNINFGKAQSGSTWMVVNDGVMGGLSNSQAMLLENAILFEGEISLENNGGFASIRSGLTDIDLSKASNVTIKYRSTGQKVGLRLVKNDRFWLPYLKTYLPTTDWEWKTETLSMDEFSEYRLENKSERELASSDFKDIIRVGLIVSNKTEGPFKLEVDYIKFN